MRGTSEKFKELIRKNNREMEMRAKIGEIFYSG